MIEHVCKHFPKFIVGARGRRRERAVPETETNDEVAEGVFEDVCAKGVDTGAPGEGYGADEVALGNGVGESGGARVGEERGGVKEAED